MLINTPKHSQQYRQTITYLNTFELHLEWIRIDYKGYIHIQWKRGKKHAESLKYQSEGNRRATPINQTLTLNITLTYHNSKVLDKNTSLCLIGDDGRLIEELPLPIHNWLGEYKLVDIGLMKGILKAKVRRRQLMQIKLPKPQQTFSPRMPGSDEEEYSEMLEQSINTHLVNSQMKAPLAFLMSSQQNQSNKLRKQLQDNIYINSKLKNDRSILLTKNAELESEMTFLKANLKEDITNLESHFKDRLEIRERIYEDEINGFVLAYNQNMEWNRKVMDLLTAEMQNTEDQIKLLKSENQHFNDQMRHYFEIALTLEKQRDSLQSRFTEITQNCQHLQQQLLQERTNKASILEEIERLKAWQISEGQRIQYQATQISQLNEQIVELQGNNFSLEEELQQNRNELQFTQAMWKKEKDNSQAKEQAFRATISRLEEVVRDHEIIQKQYKAREAIFLKERRQREEKDAKLSEERENKQKQLQSKITKEEDQNKQYDFMKKQVMRLRSELQTSHEALSSLKLSSSQEISLLKEKVEQFQTKIKQHERNESGSEQQRLKRIALLEDEVANAKAKQANYYQNQQQMNKEMKQLEYKNASLKQSLQFLNQNGIKVQDHDLLQSRLQEMQAKLAAYQQTAQNALSGSRQMDKRTSTLEQDLRIKIKRLEDENKQLKNQNQSLLGELQEIQKNERDLMKELQQKACDVKIVEYCESEEQRDQIIDEYQLPMAFNQKGKGKNIQLNKKGKLKKTQSMQVQIENPNKSNHLKKKNSSILMSSSFIVEEEISKDQQQHQKHGQPILNLATFRDQKKNMPYSINLREASLKPSPEPPRRRIPNTRIMDTEMHLVQSQELANSQMHEEKMHEEKDDNKSRSSYISGTTLYKFQRVSHKQKIKCLEEEIQQVKTNIENSKLNEESLLNQVQAYQEKTNELQNQLKVVEQEKYSLKASLHFELEKKKSQEARSAQTEGVDCISRAVEADLGKDQLERERQQNQKMLQKLDKENEQIKEHSRIRSIQLQSKLTIMTKKLEQLERRGQDLSMRLQSSQKRGQDLGYKLQQKQQQLQSQKHQTKQAEEKQKQSAAQIQSQKVQRTQLQHELEKNQAQVKTLSQTNSDLTQRLKKQEGKTENLEVLSIQLKQCQFELENSAKRILEQNRQVYQLKLEKDTIEDEMKLLRKKSSDLLKKSNDMQYQIEILEKAADEAKRREARCKRDIQEKQESIEKLRNQNKRLGDEISMMKGSSNEYMFEKKKYMEQITNLHHKIDRKQYDLVNSKKEQQRLNQRLNQKQEQKSSQKASYAKQFQSLELQVSQSNKQIVQQEATIKNLNNRLEMMNSENKRTINERSSLYSEKLKAYVQEIANIKRMLQDNSVDNDILRNQLKQLEEEIQKYRRQLGRVEQRLSQEIQNSRKLSAMLDTEHQNRESQCQQILQLQKQMHNLRNNLRTALSEKQYSQQSLANLQEEHRCLVSSHKVSSEQATRLKQQLLQSEHQCSLQQQSIEALHQAQRKLQNLNKQLKELEANYEQYRAKYRISESDLESMVKATEDKLKNRYEAAIQKITNEFNMDRETNRKYKEGETVSLLGQLETLRADGHRKMEMINNYEIKVAKLQAMSFRLSELEEQYSQKCEQVKKLGQIQSSNRSLVGQLKSLQSKQHQFEQIISSQTQQLQKQKQTIAHLQQTAALRQSELNRLEQERRTLVGGVADWHNERTVMKTEIETLVAKLRVLEDERAALMNKSEENRKDYNTKIGKLEQKLEEMAGAVHEHEKILTSSYQKQLTQLTQQLAATAQQLQQKSIQYTSETQYTSNLTSEVEQLKRDLQFQKQQEQQNAQLMEQEYARMKEKLSEKDKEYRRIVEGLELEIEEMSREFTKFKISSVGRAEDFPSSGAGIGRLQEKIKQKDAKLEEMKTSILMLEETLAKTRKKQSSLQQIAQKLSTTQQALASLQSTHSNLQSSYSALQSQANSLSSIKQELFGYRSSLEKSKLLVEEREMQLHTCRMELETIKGLYAELQKEMEKRAAAARDKYQVERGFLQQIEELNGKLAELQETNQLLMQKEGRMGDQLKKKNQQIQSLEQKISALIVSQKPQKQTQPQQHYKLEISRLHDENQALQRTVKKQREQLQSLTQEHNQTKTKLSLNQSSMDSLNSTIEEMSAKFRELEAVNRKFNDLSQACLEIFGVGLDQAVFHGWISKRLEEKDAEIQHLGEEVEELRFLNDRRLMDYDELRKQNYEMQLQLQEGIELEEQVEQLRLICDKLEKEKKDAVFREEVLKVQLESVRGGQLKERSKIDEFVRRAVNSNMSRGF